MTSFLAKSTYGMQILTKALQNRFIKKIFAKKKRMSKALFVQKKIADGSTDGQNDRQTSIFH